MSSSSAVDRYVQAMPQTFRSDRAGGLRATYQLQLTGSEGGRWTIGVANGGCQVKAGSAQQPDVTITMSTGHYLKLAAGQLDARAAYQRGDIKVEGDLQQALAFTELFRPWAAQVEASPVQPTEPTEPPAPAPGPAQPQPVPTREPTLVDYVRAMPNAFQAGKAGDLRAVYQFELSGPGGGTWSVTVANRTVTVAEGHPTPANVTIRMSGSDFIKYAHGELQPTRAYQQGRLQISGDLNLAGRLDELFQPWAETIGQETTPAPTPSPEKPKPTPSPQQPKPAPTPASGEVYPRLMNGSFDEYQPYVREGKAKVWKEDRFPERYGAYWTLEVISERKSRIHMMDSGVFGKFTQRYFGGGGRDYHIHGDHSQVITGCYGFDLVLYQTIAAEPGREYKFQGSLVSFFKGTSGPPVHDKIFKTLGIDPTGGRDYDARAVVWGERDGRDNEWRYPYLKVRAQAKAITVFIRIENTEKDVGRTELNTIHLDNFTLEAI